MASASKSSSSSVNFPAEDLRVPYDGTFILADRTTEPAEQKDGKKALEKALKKEVRAISLLQRVLYAQDRYSVLLVFQAMDAAGKDGTIRAVMSGVNPAGCHVSSFKSPSSEELDHDFLWRTACRLPERGRIGVYNRSYYEEVLAVRVHPEFLSNQRIPDLSADNVWDERFASIRDHELHLARNGTVILKFWLNVSQAEQKKRFLSRLNDPSRNWKFSRSDLSERSLWPEYMEAYESALNATSTEWAPWYAIPADNKPVMRLEVAKIIRKTLESLPLSWPEKSAEELTQFDQYRESLMQEK